MAKKNKRLHPISIDKYQTAFRKFLEDDREFQIKEYFSNGPLIARLDDEVFKIDNSYDMREFVKESLTSKEASMLIPSHYWIEVAEDVHLESEFINHLIMELTDKTEFENLNLALNISNHASNDPNVFWNTIESLDDIELYPKSIIAACKTYIIEVIIEELIECMVSDGENAFNQIQGGRFEIVDISENESTDESLFYIYNVDPIIWEIDDK